MNDPERLKEAVKGKKIILLGLKGSGKGNRARELKALGLVHIGLGNIFRDIVKKDPTSELSTKITETTRKGELLPDEIVFPKVRERLNQEDCQKHGFVLEGYPRTKIQAELLLSEISLDLVILLDVPKAFLVDGIVRFNRQSCPDCGAIYSDFDPPEKEGICDRCGHNLLTRRSDNLDVIKARLSSDEVQLTSFLPLLKKRGLVEILPITVSDDVKIDKKYLKTLGEKIYWVQTDDGRKARMLNYDGMRTRLYDLLEKRFL